MSRDPRRTRPLAPDERALLEAVLGLQPFAGRDQLQAQLGRVAVAGGAPFQLDLVVAAEVAPSDAGTGPIPTRAVVVDDHGEPVGEVIVWVTDGYLSGLEYAWFADDMPNRLPDPRQLVGS